MRLGRTGPRRLPRRMAPILTANAPMRGWTAGAHAGIVSPSGTMPAREPAVPYPPLYPTHLSARLHSRA